MYILLIYLALFSDPVSVPRLMVTKVTNATVECQLHDSTVDAPVAGYEVIRFRVSLIGEHDNIGREKKFTIRPAVPGVQYRITAWALVGAGRRSATPAVVVATTGEAGECGMCEVHHYFGVPNAPLNFEF